MNREISRRVFLERAAALGGVVSTLRIDVQARNLRQAGEETGLDSATLLTLAAMAAQIIPADETPGANDASVVDYLKARIEASEALTKQCVAGARDLNELSERARGTPFAMLDASTANQLLETTEKSEFFRRVRDLTVRGFYRSPLGWRSIGFPGPGQPHGHRDFDQPPVAAAASASTPARAPATFILVRSDTPAEDW